MDTRAGCRMVQPFGKIDNASRRRLPHRPRIRKPDTRGGTRVQRPVNRTPAAFICQHRSSGEETPVARPTKQQIEQLKRTMLEQRKALFDTTRDERVRWTQQPMGDIVGEVADPGDDSVAALITELDHAELQRRIEDRKSV